jgi:hypothetical protein
MMNTKLRFLLPVIFLTTVLSVGLVSAQTTPASMAVDDPLITLPVSDGVMFADVRRIMTEIVPRLLSKDPATLAKMAALINEASTKSGVNILAIDRVAVGVRFVGPVFPTAPKESIGIAIIVHSDAQASAVVEFLKRETKGKFTQETYGGKIIYSEPPPAPPRKRTERATPALAMLDANTIVVGDLPQVRATIDAAPGNGRVDSTLVELATRDSNALVGAAVNVPESVKQGMIEKAPKDEMAQTVVKFLSSIKQTYSSVGATPTDFNFIAGARFESPEQAQSVSDMLLGLRQQAGSFIQDQEARSILDSLQITAQGNEVQIKADIKNEVVQDFIASAMKEKKEAATATVAKPPPAKAKKTTRSRRGRRRRGR